MLTGKEEDITGDGDISRAETESSSLDGGGGVSNDNNEPGVSSTPLGVEGNENDASVFASLERPEKKFRIGLQIQTPSMRS